MAAASFTLRRAAAEDASSIAALSIEVWLGTYLRHGINGFFADYVLNTFTTAAIAAVLKDPAEQVWVSQNTQGIDGFLRLTSNSQAPVAGCSDMEISTFYVQPRHHAKGIGTALLNTAVAAAKSAGAEGLWLATNAHNTPAIDYYLAKGFIQVGHTHFTLEDEAYLNNVYALRFA